MSESTSASSGPIWFSPPSSSSTNLFSSYSSTSTRLKRADTVFFDMSAAIRVIYIKPKSRSVRAQIPFKKIISAVLFSDVGCHWQTGDFRASPFFPPSPLLWLPLTQCRPVAAVSVLTARGSSNQRNSSAVNKTKQAMLRFSTLVFN